MLDQDFRRLAGEAEEAARQPEFATVRRRAGRIRRRRLSVAGIAAAVLVAAGAGVAVAALPGGEPAPGRESVAGEPLLAARPPGSGESKVSWAGAADADHLYAITGDRLIASRDGGRTWQQRGEPRLPEVAAMLAVLGRDLLVETATTRSVPRADGTATGNRRRISRDGGRTWQPVKLATKPIDAVPAGTAAADCRLAGGVAARICAVERATGSLAPLAVQPPLTEPKVVAAPIAAGVWVHGFDQATRRPAVAVSRDAGRTWRTVVFEQELAPESGFAPVHLPNVATTDGTVAYALFVGQPDVTPHVYRSADGGATWQRSGDDPTGPDNPLAGPVSMVTRDGAHVVGTIHGSKFRYFASPDGRSYQPVTLAGLPALGHVPEAITADSYLFTSQSGIYTSSDGLTWQQVGLP